MAFWVGVVAAFAVLQATASAEERSPYPIRWTRHIKLKALSEIGPLLDEPVDMSESGGELVARHV